MARVSRASIFWVSSPAKLALGATLLFSGSAFANNPPHQIIQNHIHCGNAYCQNQGSPSPVKMIGVASDTKRGMFAVGTSLKYAQLDEINLIATLNDSCRRRARRWRCAIQVLYSERNNADWIAHVVIARGINLNMQPDKKGRYGFSYRVYVTTRGYNVQYHEEAVLQDCQEKGLADCQIIFHNNERQW